MLGLQEPEGTDSTLFLDYYDKRGPGGGAAVEYERENYFGRVLGYAIDDHGEDRLGRTRKNVEVPDELRGRFALQHRQFLPDDWQLTAEASYLSDKNFLEQYYRQEFYAGKEQETLLHAKRIEDNRAPGLPRQECASTISRMRWRKCRAPSTTGRVNRSSMIASCSSATARRAGFDTASAKTVRASPTISLRSRRPATRWTCRWRWAVRRLCRSSRARSATTTGRAFRRSSTSRCFERGKDAVGIGEAGVRASTQPFWRVYPGVESELWDLHGLRHTIRPSLTAVSLRRDQ